MTLGRYMSLCLGHPEYGYYMSRDPFGQAGDFTTAPEISQMFGEIIGAWAADCWIKMGRPEDFILLECGPGRGTLMADALRATKNLPGFHEAMDLHLLESSPVLRDRQAQILKDFTPAFHMSLKSVPKNRPVIILANEFFDALPVRQLVMREGIWKETGVSIDENDTICLYEFEVDKELVKAINADLLPPEENRIVEVSLEQNDLMHELSKTILNQGGVALIIDYGFIENASGDTLQAVRNHQYTHILDSPGECDLTAHVNFYNLGNISMTNGCAVYGPVSQGAFLNRLGLKERASVLTSHATQERALDIAAAYDRLTSRAQMGELFKVMAFTGQDEWSPEGFA